MTLDSVMLLMGLRTLTSGFTLLPKAFSLSMSSKSLLLSFDSHRIRDLSLFTALLINLLYLGFSGSAPAFSSSQVEASADTSGSTAGRTIYSMLSPGYEMMDTLPKTSRQQGRPTSESSSDSNGTTDEDEEKNEMYRPVNKRDQVYDSVTQEDTEHDSASEGQAEYDLVTPDDVQPEPVVDGNTVYMEVFLNSQGETPVPLKKDSSDTIYSQIQKSQTVVPPTQQNNFDSPEISTYENLT